MALGIGAQAFLVVVIIGYIMLFFGPGAARPGPRGRRVQSAGAGGAPLRGGRMTGAPRADLSLKLRLQFPEILAFRTFHIRYVLRFHCLAIAVDGSSDHRAAGSLVCRF
jgi:hypothetical protein